MEGKEDKKRIKCDRRYEGERNIEKEEREGRKGKDITKNKEYSISKKGTGEYIQRSEMEDIHVGDFMSGFQCLNASAFNLIPGLHLELNFKTTGLH